MNYVIKIILVSLLGAILCGLLSGAYCHYVLYNYYTPGANPGIGSARNFLTGVGAIIGLICGCIGGLILSLVIAIIGIPKVPSFFIGAVINGIIPIMIFLLSGAFIMKDIFSPPKDLWLFLLGQFIVGGVISLLISILTNTQQNPLD